MIQGTCDIKRLSGPADVAKVGAISAWMVSALLVPAGKSTGASDMCSMTNAFIQIEKLSVAVVS